MKVSRQLKSNFHKVVFITIGYVIINLFLSFFSYAIINSPYTLGPSLLFNVKSYFLTNILTGVITGWLGGVLLVSVNSQLFRRRSFKFAMLTTLLAYVLLFLLVTIVGTLVHLLGEHGLQGMSYDLVKTSLGFVYGDSTLIAYFVLWGFITLATLFLLQVNDKFGPGILIKFLAGKYHHPKKKRNESLCSWTCDRLPQSQRKLAMRSTLIY